MEQSNNKQELVLAVVLGTVTKSKLVRLTALQANNWETSCWGKE